MLGEKIENKISNLKIQYISIINQTRDATEELNNIVSERDSLSIIYNNDLSKYNKLRKDLKNIKFVIEGNRDYSSDMEKRLERLKNELDIYESNVLTAKLDAEKEFRSEIDSVNKYLNKSREKLVSKENIIKQEEEILISLEKKIDDTLENYTSKLSDIKIKRDNILEQLSILEEELISHGSDKIILRQDIETLEVELDKKRYENKEFLLGLDKREEDIKKKERYLRVIERRTREAFKRAFPNLEFKL